jgi:magnesium transporter
MITYYHSSARARDLAILDQPKAGSWVHAVQPSSSELDELAEKLNLDRNILNDAIDAYEAPRVEVDNGATYVFVRYCRPEDPDIPTEPMLIIYTSDYIVTVMRSNDNILELLVNGTVTVLTTQKTKTFLHILEQINRSYRLQLNIVAKQILRFRAQLRLTEVTSVDIIRFIELEEDVNEFLSALQPMGLVLNALETGKYMRLYEDDRDLAEDIMLNTSELIELSRSRLRSIVNIRQAYDAIATNNLNRTFRRLTSIAIFMTVPTIIGGIFGMNVALPFQHNQYAFLGVILLIFVSIAGFVYYFRRRNWF